VGHSPEILGKLVLFGGISECPDHLLGCPYNKTTRKRALIFSQLCLFPKENLKIEEKKCWPLFRGHLGPPLDLPLLVISCK